VVETNPTLCVSDLYNDYRNMNAQPLVVAHPHQIDQKVWDLTRYSGGNPKAFQSLLNRHGYESVHCEKCGVNCFFVKRSEIPRQCRSMLHNHAPSISYPCFSTLAENGKDTRIGHPVDALQRPVVVADESLIELLSQNHSAFDIDKSLQTETLSNVVFSAKTCGQASSADVRVGETVLKVSLGAASTVCRQPLLPTPDATFLSRPSFPSDALVRGQIQFARGDLGGAFASFEAVTLALTTTDSNGGRKSEESSLVPCQSKHPSESACLLLKVVHYNAAVTAVHLANNFAAAAAAGRERERAWLARALQHAQQAVLIDTEDAHTGPLYHLLQLVSMPTRENMNWAQVTTFTLNVHLPPQEVAVSVTLCDSPVAEIQSLCLAHATPLDVCQRLQDNTLWEMQVAVAAQVSPYLALRYYYQRVGLVQSNSSRSDMDHIKAAERRVWKHLFPACIRNLSVVQHLLSCQT